MQSCDVLIVGAGPAGASCAWKLKGLGFDVLILDKQRFPRDKICGGWITPQVLGELQIDPQSYADGRVLQPIRGFRAGRMGGAQVQIDYEKPVSFGIRRLEFDHYLLERSGARLLQATALVDLRRSGDQWIVNDQIKTPLVIGAGGHFCPVARFLGATLGREVIVAAQEIEFAMDARQQEECDIDPEVPELYFCLDMKGYGWAFRKKSFLNLGLGRLGNRSLSKNVASFIDFLKAKARISLDIPATLNGHAYLLYGFSPRNLLGDGILLIGDAAGLAYPRSGEGIRPAVESGLLAAGAVLAACGKYDQGNLASYPRLLEARFGSRGREGTFSISSHLPEWLTSFAAGKLLAVPWFLRHVFLDRWFLHSHQPALAAGGRFP